MKKYPLYSAEIIGEIGGYLMVIVTKWTDDTEKATEVSHKCYYFKPNYFDLYKIIKKENWCKNLYNNFREYSKFEN